MIVYKQTLLMRKMFIRVILLSEGARDGETVYSASSQREDDFRRT